MLKQIDDPDSSLKKRRNKMSRQQVDWWMDKIQRLFRLQQEGQPTGGMIDNALKSLKREIEDTIDEEKDKEKEGV